MKNQIRIRWNQDAKNYNRSTECTWNSEYERSAWISIFENIISKDKMTVLDVGTGPGIIAFFLAELGKKVMGIDLSENMIQIARRNARDYNLDVDFRVGDAENLPFDDESFDAVVNRQSIYRRLWRYLQRQL